jgi:predicted CXXCH cytochrome family protein
VNSCATCHEPHGSINPKMLRRTQVVQLCLECHSMTPGVAAVQPPAFHDIRTARFRNCTVCHREIHGSNVDPAFFR